MPNIHVRIKPGHIGDFMRRKNEANLTLLKCMNRPKINAKIDPKWRSTCFNSLPCQVFMSALSLAKHPYCRFHAQKKRSKIDPTQVHKPSKNRRQNRSQLEGLGNHFGSLGASFWNRFGNLDGFWLPSASWEAFVAIPWRFYKPR